MLKKNITLTDKTILITGAAGFIGANLVMALLQTEGKIKIIGIDNLNGYYDTALKEYRLRQVQAVEEKSRGSFLFIKVDIADKQQLEQVFFAHQPQVVVNLAAQAGVRYSIDNPDAYIQANVIGFYNVLEACRQSYANGAEKVEHLIYASSSSVYGSNSKIPYAVGDQVDNPVSLYAATKKSNELFAYAYAKLYKIPVTGLRFFTVYGPAGRPDMAYFSFTNKLLAGEKIQIFNYGNCKRDFTYIDDIVTGVIEIMQRSPMKDEGGVPYKIYNIGNSQPENLLDFVTILGEELKRARVLSADYDLEAHKELVAMQPGDVEVTFADVSELEKDTGFKPRTTLREGLWRFAVWYKSYFF